MNLQTDGEINAELDAVAVFKNYTLETLALALESAAPPPKKITTGSTLAALKNELAAAKKRGHDAESMAAVLRTGGLKVSRRMVADLLRDVQKKTRTK